jgi:hypothetical protein
VPAIVTVDIAAWRRLFHLLLKISQIRRGHFIVVVVAFKSGSGEERV